MGNELPDESLMQRIARNETAAFDALFLRHRRAVFSFTFRMVGDGTTAEDLTAGVFLEGMQAAHRFSGDEKALRAWLFRIGRHNLIDHIRTTGGNWDWVLYLFAGIYLAGSLSWLALDPRRPAVPVSETS